MHRRERADQTVGRVGPSKRRARATPSALGRHGREAAHRERLIAIVTATPWLMRALEAVRAAGPADAWIGAGAVRGTVWDCIHGYSGASPSGDVDVVYFDAGDTSSQADVAYERRLSQQEPSLHWEVVNQAGVHLWYEETFGQRVPALASLEEGIGSWPETATAVAVRLGAGSTVEVLAPLGLDDLFECVVRRNPARATVAMFRERVVAKRYTQRWPRVRVVREQRSGDRTRR